ncbi:MAG TPA: FAD-dependent oxidoreductase [Acidimicrobiales bacterium]|jgi:monoamine oxidase|nr:FAD-dependent oxidoreductase [Acidimicrobiales bacterium]
MPLRAVASRWASDPDIATAYSYLRPGGTPADRDRLADAIAPGLYLAGEAMSSEYPGTMHGAWFSGERAARRALAEDGRPARSAIVVGAGLAGFAAARHLRDAGCAVTVLEQADVAGGRIRTDRSLGVPVHLGAAWLHGDVGNPVADRAAALGIGTTPSRWGTGTTFLAGRGRLDDDADKRLRDARAAVDDGIERAQRFGTEQDALGPVVRDLIDRHAASADDRLVLDAWVNGVFENLYAAPVDDLSLLHCEEPFRLPGRDLTLTQGLDGFVASLADDLDLRCRVRVRAIRANGACWSVETDDTTPLDADVVIVTVPVGALKHGRIRFDPPLPAPIAKSLEHIGAGRIAKVFCTFDEAFWSPLWSFWVVASPRLPIALWVDASTLAGRPVLCGMATRDNAELVERLSEPDLRALAARCLDAAGEF